MVSFFESSIQQIIVHHIGNSLQNEMYALADESLALKDELITQLLMQYF
jgi:hypothetical protein